MARLFVELDGVLADYAAGAASALGMTCRDFLDLHGDRVMQKHLAAVPEFYSLLPWTSDGADLWLAMAGVPTWPQAMILTGLPGGWADRQKRDWCSRELGAGTVVITAPLIDKAKYCVAGDVLVDARAASRLDWETAGGVFVLHEGAASTLARLSEIFSEGE